MSQHRFCLLTQYFDPNYHIYQREGRLLFLARILCLGGKNCIDPLTRSQHVCCISHQYLRVYINMGVVCLSISCAGKFSKFESELWLLLVLEVGVALLLTFSFTSIELWRGEVCFVVLYYFLWAKFSHSSYSFSSSHFSPVPGNTFSIAYSLDTGSLEIFIASPIIGFMSITSVCAFYFVRYTFFVVRTIATPPAPCAYWTPTGDMAKRLTCEVSKGGRGSHRSQF